STPTSPATTARTAPARHCGICTEPAPRCAPSPSSLSPSGRDADHPHRQPHIPPTFHHSDVIGADPQGGGDGIGGRLGPTDGSAGQRIRRRAGACLEPAPDPSASELGFARPGRLRARRPRAMGAVPVAQAQASVDAATFPAPPHLDNPDNPDNLYYPDFLICPSRTRPAPTLVPMSES